MARLIPAVERITRSRALIQKARDLPAPVNTGLSDFSYVAQVKDLMRQARDLIRFIPLSPSASSEMKAEVAAIFKEIEQAEIDLLH
ncbi:MAG: hypothetical protein LLG42_09470 [Chloroflexi bacterium]|nr:hypothetical protein [Chloroflexota bacterium]